MPSSSEPPPWEPPTGLGEVASGTRALPRRVRLEDVAAQAGVTKSVASRVLNEDPTLRVRAATRQRVRHAATSLGYRPHASARSLAAAETRALALLVPDLTNPTYASIGQGAFRAAQERGYVLLMAEDQEDLADVAQFTELAASGRVDGLLIASASPRSPILNLLADGSLPYVFVNRAVPGSGRNVTMDVAAASVLAVEYLHGRGRRAVGHVAGPRDVVPTWERERSFREAAAALGMPDAPVERDAISEHGGYRAARRLLATGAPLDAVYVSTLSQAVGVLHALREAALDVPGDVAVVSFDDMPLAEFLDPPLTTIAMPLGRLGGAAVDALVRQIQGDAAADVVLDEGPRLRERSSS
jgi:LacI family transcriptional regulator